jgi:ParB family chromosome partitioning protein
MSYINQTIFLSQIRPGPYQNRQDFDRNALESLGITIREHGLLNPPIVYREGDFYRLIAGERRWRMLCAVHLCGQGLMTWPQAMDMVSAEDARQRLLDRATYLSTIEIEVRVPMTGSNHRVLSVIENGQRRNLNPVEEAQDYQALLDDGYTAAEVADLAGKSEKTIQTTVTLLDLEPEVQEMLISGDLDKTRGIALATVKDRDAQIGLAQRAVKHGMRATAVEAACRAYNKQQASGSRKTTPDDCTAAPPAKPVTIPLGQVKAIPLYRPAQHHHLNPDSIDYILALGEECCNGCLDNGFSARCLKCDGFTEFANLLFREVNYEPHS